DTPHLLKKARIFASLMRVKSQKHGIKCRVTSGYVNLKAVSFIRFSAEYALHHYSIAMRFITSAIFNFLCGFWSPDRKREK
ncbi:MAG: hypothetical protein E7J78_21145, partial [Pantoea sp.]|nr:hypothetical protein [Pantoea sp.]